MRRAILYGCLVWLACMAVACNTSGVGEGEAPDGSLCPSCLKGAGGETGDFGGQVECKEHEQPVDAHVEHDFALPRLKSLLGSRQTLQARWVSLESAVLPMEGTTSIELAFEVGPVRFLTSEQGPPCGDRIEAELTVHAHVGEDTLTTSGRGILLQQRGQPGPHIYARADLKAATGTLKLDIDRSRRHRGTVEIVLDIFDDVVRGELIPSVTYFDQEEQPHEEWSAGTTQAWFKLRFPVDECEASALPLVVDEPAALLGGRPPRELLAEVQSKLAGMGPYEGRWLDATLGEVSVGLDLRAGATLCAGGTVLGPLGGGDVPPPGWEVGTTVVHGWSGARLRGERGLELELDSISFDVSAETGELRAAIFRYTEDLKDAAALMARTGLTPEVAAGTPLQIDAQLAYMFPPGAPPTVDGKVEVLALENNIARRVECLGWPVNGAADKDCQYHR